MTSARFLQVFDERGAVDATSSALFPISWIAKCPDSGDALQHEFGKLFLSTFFSAHPSPRHVPLALSNSSGTSGTSSAGSGGSSDIIFPLFYNSSLLRVWTDIDGKTLKVEQIGAEKEIIEYKRASFDREAMWIIVPDRVDPFGFVFCCTTRHNQHYTGGKKVFYHVRVQDDGNPRLHLRCIPGFDKDIDKRNAIYSENEYSFGQHSFCDFDFRNPVEVVCTDDLLIVSIAHRDMSNTMAVHCHDLRKETRWAVSARCGYYSFFRDAEFEKNRIIKPRRLLSHGERNVRIDLNVDDKEIK